MKIKNRILVSSFLSTILSMFLVFLVFYFFIFSEAKKERLVVFEAQSKNITEKFSNHIDYYMTVVDKNSLSKEFLFLLNKNYFVSNLSVNSSKKLIQKIKNQDNAIQQIYILDNNGKDKFDKKLPIDIDELISNKMIIKDSILFVYSYIGDKKDMLIIQVDLREFKINLHLRTNTEYYLISNKNNILFGSDNFIQNKFTNYSEQTGIIDKGSYLYYSSHVGNYNFITKVSKSNLFDRINKLFLIVFISILVITFLSLIQSIKSSSILTSSIYKLIQILKSNDDGKYSKVILSGADEIEYFAKIYNEMIDRISIFTYDLEEKVKLRTKEIENQKEELKILSQTDTLTGVYNRNKLNEIMIGRQKYDAIYSVIIMDIDDFKVINDTYGHNDGDVILKEFASVLQKSTRKSDFLGRWGGEEFIIICSDVEKEQALKIADEIRKKIQKHKFYKGIKLTASFGVAQYTKGISYDELFILADTALYKAKDGGKNRVVSS